jgi:hypothetical protein
MFLWENYLSKSVFSQITSTAPTTKDDTMAVFYKVTGWNASRQESYDTTINLDHVVSISRDENEGRTVINLTGGGQITAEVPYNHFVGEVVGKAR